MHHHPQALLRMRQGNADRDIATARVMGRPKAAQWRRIATEHGCLDPAQPLPEDEAISAERVTSVPPWTGNAPAPRRKKKNNEPHRA